MFEELRGKTIVNVMVKEAVSEDGEQVDAILMLHLDNGTMFYIGATDPISERYVVMFQELSEEQLQEYEDGDWQIVIPPELV